MGSRIDKPVGVLAVAFALSYHWGRELERKTGTKLKKHGYRAKIVFRQSFESLHQMPDAILIRESACGFLLSCLQADAIRKFCRVV